MAIVVKNTGGGFQDSSTELTTSFNCPTGTELLVVSVADGWFQGPATVTFNGTGLTKAVGIADTDNGSHASIWYLLSPSIGTYNVVTTAIANRARVHSIIALSGVNTTTPTGNSATNRNNGTARTVDCTSTGADNMVIDSMSGDSSNTNTITIGANQTLIYKKEWTGSSGSECGASSYEVGTGTRTMSWANSLSGYWAMAALEIKAPAASGPANLKSINGIAIASVKSKNGLAKASIKNINGLE